MEKSWLKVVFSDALEFYGELQGDDPLVDPKARFVTLGKTAKLEWLQDKDTGETRQEIVPTAPRGSSGRMFINLDKVQYLAAIPENTNLVRSILAHYSQIQLTRTMPAGPDKMAGNKLM